MPLMMSRGMVHTHLQSRHELATLCRTLTKNSQPNAAMAFMMVMGDWGLPPQDSRRRALKSSTGMSGLPTMRVIMVEARLLTDTHSRSAGHILMPQPGKRHITSWFDCASKRSLALQCALWLLDKTSSNKKIERMQGCHACLST